MKKIKRKGTNEKKYSYRFFNTVCTPCHISIFPYLYGYQWSVSSFNGEIHSWEELSPLVSLITLFLIFMTTLVSLENMHQIRQQRKKSIKPQIILYMKPFNIKYNIENNTSYITKSLKDKNIPSFNFINVGLDTAIDIDISVNFKKEELEEILEAAVTNDYQRHSFIDKEKLKKFIDIRIHSISTLLKKYENGISEIKIPYLAKDQESNFEFPPLFQHVYSIIALFNTTRNDNKKFSFPKLEIKINYMDIDDNDYNNIIFHIDPNIELPIILNQQTFGAYYSQRNEIEQYFIKSDEYTEQDNILQMKIREKMQSKCEIPIGIARVQIKKISRTSF